MVPEAQLESTEHGLVAKGEGWFVLNARDAVWGVSEGRGTYSWFEGEPEFSQLGIHLVAMEPGEPMSMYHWEADQEDFLVLSGEALLIIEGEERPLRQWDFVHCPPEAKHTIIGAGDSTSLVLAVGARDKTAGPNWGGYSVDETATRHGAGVEQETSDPAEAYARYPARHPERFRRTRPQLARPLMVARSERLELVTGVSSGRAFPGEPPARSSSLALGA